jgi:hypothetical protein
MGAMDGLDAWLEAPYTNRAREEAEFEAWCESTGRNPESDEAWEHFEQAMADAQEDSLIAAAERRADR